MSHDNRMFRGIARVAPNYGAQDVDIMVGSQVVQETYQRYGIEPRRAYAEGKTVLLTLESRDPGKRLTVELSISAKEAAELARLLADMAVHVDRE